MRHWLVANADAGDGSRGRDFWLEHLRGAGLGDVAVRDFSDTTWAREVREGDLVMVAGGDGSVSRGAALCLERNATLAVLPSGTANDFSRNLGLPEDPLEICRLIASGRTVNVDVGWINDTLFLNVAHIGLGTVPARKASANHKRALGRFSYLAVLARRIGIRWGFQARITHDGGSIEGLWLSIAISSGAFFGGGQRIPEATLDDGELNIVAVRPRSWVNLLMTFLVSRLRGRQPRDGSTLVHVKSTRCQVQLRHSRTLTADGEDLGRIKEATASTRPGALRVVCERLLPA
ncbi:diacylglycerol/lipid kinase family protein [Halomonas kalidii]|uniref:Diacylglycerol kinase family protein n=1 Tax=Halomonas kalidii TaxID=3043293 RepID=A0ABT6VFT4_9GAMM|nr:diacylglycerol kinase family protein [Halomonas kalidii]MDI5932840.1 diacylglycerol kinase family protein [Halomonas kalidii]